MIVSLNAFSLEELDRVSSELGSVGAFLRSIGHFNHAATVLAHRSMVNQHVLRREADHRQYVARQLSLAPPSAYVERETI